METILKLHDTITGPWDEEHVKALLHFPRFPVRLIQQEPWQSWIGERGGLKEVHEFLQDYPFAPSRRRILDVVLSNPEAVANVYADCLNISRATYFYQLRDLITEIFQALNHWDFHPTVVSESLPPYQFNLPTPLTNLVGVDTTLNKLLHLFLYENVRLLTLFGPGGIGKTRLSIELAHKLSYETCFMDLTTLRDPSHLIKSISTCLGIKNSSVSELKTTLRNKDFLLILDNFEHILPARSFLSELLGSLPRLRIIVTSRVSLNIYGEYEFRVPPLAINAIETVKDQQLWATSPAVVLFAQRAQAVCPSFSLNNGNVEDIAVLCQWLEGLPLAIELAAYQIKYFSPQAMLTRLKRNRLTFLDNGPKGMPPQQQTIRAMFDWSFFLLPSDLQDLFCQLSVFDQGFKIEEAQNLSPIADIQSQLDVLIDHSFLEQHPGADGEPYFQMLGMAREYARERLLVNKCLDKKPNFLDNIVERSTKKERS